MNWDELTPRQRDALVAEFMGWKFQRPTHGPCCTCQHCGRHYDDCCESCHYTTEREAALPVEDEIERMGLARNYIDELVHIVDVPALDDTLWDWMLLRATPDQRCLAALRAKGVAV